MITGVEYRLVGDYYLPNVVVPKPGRTGNIEKYRRLKYLEEYHIIKCIFMIFLEMNVIIAKE